MVKLTGTPEQPGLALIGVSVMVAVIGVNPVFCVLNGGKNPDALPVAAKPISGCVFVQLKSKPPTAIPPAVVFAQTVWLLIAAITGAASTIRLKLLVPPKQPAKEDCTVT